MPALLATLANLPLARLTGWARRHSLPVAKRSSIGQSDFMSTVFNE